MGTACPLDPARDAWIDALEADPLADLDASPWPTGSGLAWEAAWTPAGTAHAEAA